MTAKIKRFAKKWLKNTGQEILTDTMQGFDFVSDCYEKLSDSEKSKLSRSEFFELLQNEISEQF